jgi:hypothetical protein
LMGSGALPADSSVMPTSRSACMMLITVARDAVAGEFGVTEAVMIGCPFVLLINLLYHIVDHK